MTKLFIILSLLSISSAAFSQFDSGLKGSVQDQTGDPISFANLVLYQMADSSLAKVEYTKEDGSFEIQGINEGAYQLEVSYVGYPTWKSNTITIGSGQLLTLDPIEMSSQGTDLTEVVVKAQKSLIEIQPDKTVFNVEGSINASGSDALELLRKSPGLVVDNNDNILMAGKNGVQIYINNRPSQLSQEDLVEMLKNMQASEVEAIEIITNPSSKYDAEGNAGIINIRLKKAKGLGTNASLSLGYSQGKFPKYNGSINVNHRNEKMNVYGSYSHNTSASYNYVNFYREIAGQSFKQNSGMVANRTYHGYKAGIDYVVNDKSTFGAIIDGSFGDRLWKNSSRAEIGRVGVTPVDSLLIATSESDSKRLNLDANVNYRYDDKQGTVWSADLNYGIFAKDEDAFQPNYYTDLSEAIIYSESIFRTITPTDIDIWSAKANHERKLLGGKLEMGMKYSSVITDNTFGFYDVLSGVDVYNSDRSNKFVYKENVSAAYVNFQKQVKKVGLQAGLRVEHTSSLGELTSTQQSSDKEVDRKYTDFFPSGGLTWQANPKTMWRLNYSKRIQRPNYEHLNPFEYKLDELTYRRGNPFLQPQYTHAVSLTHSYNYRFNTSLNYSYTKDYFTQISDTTEVNKSYMTQRNLSSQQVWSLNISAPFSITQKWSTYTNLNTYYQHNEADFGEGKTVDVEALAFTVYSQHTLMLPKGWSWELSGFYNSPGIWGGNFETKEMWGIDTGFKKKVLGGRGTLKVAVSDIFNTMNWGGIGTFGGLYSEANGGWESRRLRLNFSYMFGKQDVKIKKRQTGLEAETKRTSGGGGSGGMN